MAMEFSSGFGANSLIWISSLHDDEMDMTNRIVSELGAFLRTMPLAFACFRVNDPDELYGLLDGIAQHAREGARPMIHLDMHGNEDGLGIKTGGGRIDDGELAPWEEVIPRLQEINLATQGNLCVVAGVCYALHAVLKIKMQEPCAMHILIAPEESVYVDFLEDSTVAFYRELFTTSQIHAAHERYLSSELKIFYSEKLLAGALVRYIKHACLGSSGEERKKRLLEESMRHLPNTPEIRENMQKILEGISQPDQALVDRHAGIFLAGRSCPFTIDDLMQLVESK
jgi:hypothetical protein